MVFRNCLSLNVSKCKIMSYCRRNNCHEVVYTLGTSTIDRCNTFTDLGVIFDKNLSFNLHVDSLISKANSRLGLIKRWSKEINDPHITKCLFTGLVRSILEFSCPVWNPYYTIHKNRLESIQKQFLIFALKDLNWNDNFRLPPYKHRLLLLDMNTLEDRRETMSCMVIFNLLSGKMSSSYLLSNISFNCPMRSTRNYTPLKMDFYTQNYLRYEPFTQCLNYFNVFYFLVDFCHNSVNQKNIILNYLKLSVN